jgi:hypothetical protein
LGLIAMMPRPDCDPAFDQYLAWRAEIFARIAQFTSGPSANRLKINCQNISDSNQRKTKRLATSIVSIRQALNC